MIEVERPFHLSESKALGFGGYASSSRGNLEVPFAGVRRSPLVTESILVPAWAVDDARWWDARNALAALQVVRPDAIAASRTAAQLHGLPVDPPADVLEVAVPAGASRVGRPRVRERRSTRHDGVRLAGVDVQRQSWVLLELAEVLTAAQLVVVLDAVMGHWNTPPAATPVQVAAVFSGARGCRGRRKLEAALKRARTGVRSPRETRLRLRLVDAGLPEPVVAHPVWVDALGRAVHPDLSYPRVRFAIEYEGEQHRTDPNQFGYDLQRYFHLEQMGWTVLRVSKSMSLDWVTDQVRAVLAAKGMI